ncbi:hypothetical protein LCGC14_2974570, partial [marine sediment metagenome]
MTRIIDPKRDQEGTLYHYCPAEKKNVGVDLCRECPLIGKVEELPTRYRVHCDYSGETDAELIQFDVAKAHSEVRGLSRERVIESVAHTWVEPKLDGARALVHCTPEGVFITSRRRNKAGAYNQFQDNVPHLRDHPKLVALGRDGYTILDGELVMTEGKGGALGSTMSVVGSKPARAIEAQEEHGKAVLYLFDVCWFEGQDVSGMSLENRRCLLEDLFTPNEAWIALVQVWRHTDVEARQDLLTRYLEEGHEGLVIKDPSSTYSESRAWLKVKQRLSVDGLVTGWHHGAVGGKWEHGLGDLAVSVIDEATGELREICTVIPGDDETRARLFKQLSPLSGQQISDLGMVVELEGQGWSQEYRIRHPRILRY